jgi:3',5'-cyclic AMP phosphodiesterase CpdA
MDRLIIQRLLRHLLAGAVAAALLLPVPAAADTGILAIGDFGVGGTTERRMGAAMEQFATGSQSDALVTLGDNDYTESPSAFRRNWLDSFGWAAEDGLVVAGTLGNHDVRVQGGRYQHELLGIRGDFYRRAVGDVALFLINSNRSVAAQRRWLDQALASSVAPWKIVVFHHPPYTCGEYSGVAEMRRQLVPLFERHGVDLVLSGHDHNYQRFGPRNGVTYVVHGGGGAGLYPVRSCPAGFPKRHAARAVRGWLHILASPTSLRVRAIGPMGRVLDQALIPQ